MNRGFLFVLLLAALVLSILGAFWIENASFNQSLLASTAKALDYAEGWRTVGGPPWWTPSFLQGSSLALTLTNLTVSAWLLLWVQLAGIFAGSKIAALLCVLAACLAVYALGKHLTGDSLAAAACATAFLFMPPVYFRLVHAEDMVSVAVFAVIPFLLLRLAILLEKPHRLNGLFFGAAAALLLITDAEAVALLLPLGLAYAIALWLWRQRTLQAPGSSLGSALLAALLTVLILGVLPLLPALREMQLAIGFDLAPLESWQRIFSLKNALPLFDRGGFLTQGMPAGFTPTSALGSSYLGLIPVLLVGVVLIAKRANRDALYATRIGGLCRLFIALTLAAFWLSCGPNSVLTGQFAFLSMAFNAANPVIALSWFLLLMQGWMIHRLLHPSLPGRHLIAGALIAVYLLVPGFRLISWLPLYSDLRAPQDFFQIVGFFFWVLASGCAFRLVMDMLSSRVLRRVAALLLLLLAVLDVSPSFRPFFRGPVDEATFADFKNATTFLSEASEPGWVHPLSGRYFYLLTPHFAERGLTSEAFHSYHMLGGTAYFQALAQTSDENQKAYLKMGGVSHILIDRTDPDTGQDLKDRFKSLLPTAFENDHFLVLKNTNSLAPAFLAQKFITEKNASFMQLAQTGLSLAKQDIIVLPEAPGTFAAQSGKVGSLEEDGPVIKPESDDAPPRPFLPLALTAPRRENYQQIALAPPGKSGWAIMPEAYHPDWTASSQGQPLTVLPADGALLAVQVTDPDQPITLHFAPPWWYNGFLAVAALGWLGCGLLTAALFVRVPLPKKFKTWLIAMRAASPAPSSTAEFARGAIKRALVIIPTYNEAQSLSTVLNRIFADDATIEVLVVDDNSPDGTGGLVKAHSEFDRRLHLLTRRGKLGLGSAYREGFQWAFAQGFDACLEMDADLSHDPADIPRLLAALDAGAGVDAAIGSRYLGGVRVMNWPEHRLLLSTGATRFVRLITGMPLTDATSGFKALRCATLKTLDENLFRAEGYGFQVELHHALWQAGAKIVEIPIVFTERLDGKTKMTLGIALEAAWRTIRLALHKK